MRGAAARDFGRGQGGEVRASPQRAVSTEPTKATAKRPAARRVFAQRAVWLRCSSVEDPPGIFSFVAPDTALCAKTAPLRIFRQALTRSRSSAPCRSRLSKRSQCSSSLSRCRLNDCWRVPKLSEQPILRPRKRTTQWLGFIISLSPKAAGRSRLSRSSHSWWRR